MEGTWEDLETQLKNMTSYRNCYHLSKSGGGLKKEYDSPDFNGTVGFKVNFNTSNDNIKRHILEEKKVRYQGLKGRIKKFRLMEIKIKVNLITKETKATCQGKHQI